MCGLSSYCTHITPCLKWKPPVTSAFREAEKVAMMRRNSLRGIRRVVKGGLHSAGLLEAARHIRDLEAVRHIRDRYCAKTLRRRISSHALSQRHQFVVSVNDWGLGNRIKCLVSGMRLADKLSRAIALNWTPNIYCGCLFSDLFENRILELSDYEVKRLVVNKIHPFENHEWHVLNTWRLLTLPDDVPDNFSRASRISAGKYIDFEYDRIPWTVRNDFLRYFSALVPIESIKKEVEKFSTEFDDNTISISIRSWADSYDKARSRFFSIENVYRILDKEGQSSFFVVCDSEDVLNHIIRRYGRRVISYPHRKIHDRLSRRGVQEALIVLLLLSKNKRFIVSTHTTFPEVAWWLGGCRARIERIEPNHPELEEKLYDKIYLEEVTRASYHQAIAAYEERLRAKSLR